MNTTPATTRITKEETTNQLKAILNPTSAKTETEIERNETNNKTETIRIHNQIQNRNNT
jgi:hypothetical protein